MKVHTRPGRPADGKRASFKRVLLSPYVMPVLAATLFLGSAVPAFSAVGIDIRIAPPAPRVVVAPPPRPGFIWAPGYYRWDGHHHVWADGRWLRERRGHHWVPDHWNERHGRYHYEPGHWERG